MKELKILPLDATAEKIRAVLTPDLLSAQWRKKGAESAGHPLTGHCYVASEAYFHVLGKSNGFAPKMLSGEGWTHWWLENKQGEIIDLTQEQVGQLDGFAYEAGKGKGFLTRDPSKRAQIALARAGLAYKKARGVGY